MDHSMAAMGYGSRCLWVGHSQMEVRCHSRSLPANFGLPLKKYSKKFRNAQMVLASSRSCSVAGRIDNSNNSPLLDAVTYRAIAKKAGSGRCGCGARSEFFGQGASLSARSTKALDDDGIAGADRKTKFFASELADEQRQRGRTAARHASDSTVVFALERDGRKEFAKRVQSTISYNESLGVEGRKVERPWGFISAAAAAGLSFTLCSSAMASPITDGWTQMMPTTESKSLKVHVETQLRRELQAQIIVQKEWLEEIGQPLSEWSIDERVRKILEDKARSRMDESGKAVSKLEMLESEVVPIFRPKVVVVQKNEKVNSTAGSTREAISEKVADGSQGRSVEARERESSLTSTTKHDVDGAPELVAVAAIPLGSVVSAASRTVGSAASIATVQAAGKAVPGVNLLTRIMMHFGGGGVAGAMGATLVYPLDTIKTRIQAQSNKEGEAKYKDEWDCLHQLVAKEGPGSLYSGLVPQLIGIAPEKAMKLTVNEVLMEMLESQMPGVGVWALELIAGGGGGFSQVVFTNPMEIVKVRLQTQSKDAKQKNSWDVIKELGVRGLYNGSTMTMARDIPSSAIFFAIYTLIRQVYPDQSFMAGFVAAIPATVLVTPFDVVKTRLQMEKTDGEGEEHYENSFECFSLILQDEGIGALFKGSFARVLKTSPQFGITLMLYNLLCSAS